MIMIIIIIIIMIIKTAKTRRIVMRFFNSGLTFNDEFLAVHRFITMFLHDKFDENKIHNEFSPKFF